MSILTVEEKTFNALNVAVTDDTLMVELDDGRNLLCPNLFIP